MGPFYVEINGIQATNWIQHLPYAQQIVDERRTQGSREDLTIINTVTRKRCCHYNRKFNKLI